MPHFKILARGEFTSKEWHVIQRLSTPLAVQKFFTTMPYNWENQGGTMRSFREVLKRNEAHCLEAAVGAAVILEQQGYPPLLLDLESWDLLDHVVFVFQERGRWGAVARSRDRGLHGRRPVFRTIRDLVWSYFDPYIDFSGRIIGYGVADLRELGSYDWRFSAKNMHKIEDYLRAMPHRKLSSSDKRYQYWSERYKTFKQRYPNRSPKYYPNQKQWMM